MKCVAHIAFAFSSFCAFLVQDTKAATAIVIGTKGPRHVVCIAWGFTVGLARQNAVKLANRNTAGFGAAAIWRHGEDWILGVALGCRSSQEAQKRAILDCKRKGGVAPDVRWGWKG